MIELISFISLTDVHGSSKFLNVALSFFKYFDCKLTQFVSDAFRTNIEITERTFNYKGRLKKGVSYTYNS